MTEESLDLHVGKDRVQNLSTYFSFHIIWLPKSEQNWEIQIAYETLCFCVFDLFLALIEKHQIET